MEWETPVRQAASTDEAPSAKCANCKMPIETEPVEKGGRTFCCDGCADGGPCLC